MEQAINDIIEENCLGCDEFHKNLRQSGCICQQIADTFERFQLSIYNDEAVAEWKAQRKRFLRAIGLDADTIDQ